MERSIILTVEALRACTPKQLGALCLMAESSYTVEVTTALYGLPQGYVTFTRKYDKDHKGIFGGISPEGEVST